MGTIDQLSNPIADITIDPVDADLKKHGKSGTEFKGDTAAASTELLPSDNVNISDSAKVVSSLLSEPTAFDKTGHSKTDGFNLPQHLRASGAASVGFDLEKHPDREIAWLNYKVLEVLAKNADIMDRAISKDNIVEQVERQRSQQDDAPHQS